jgi:hypothetical protein
MATKFNNGKFQIQSNHIFVDSTYGTEESKMELYVLIGTFNGEGFPLSYFYVKRDKTKGIYLLKRKWAA